MTSSCVGVSLGEHWSLPAPWEVTTVEREHDEVWTSVSVPVRDCNVVLTVDADGPECDEASVTVDVHDRQVAALHSWRGMSVTVAVEAGRQCTIVVRGSRRIIGLVRVALTINDA